jgi:hypothetical protein
MRRALAVSVFLAAFVFAFVGVASAAHAEVVEYMSRHPLPKRVGHGFCDIDVPHFHDYPPSDPRLYRQVNGQYYFVGDPTPFDYDGPKYSFYGPHPITDPGVQFGGPTYCYIRGPHSHWYAPPPQAQFEMRGGAYWYVGAYDPVYYSDQPRFVVINDFYTPLVYARPVIDVRIAPPAFRGEIFVGGGWRGGPGGPGMRMGGPEPRFEHREMVMREHHEQEMRREQEHRGWEQREREQREHGHGPHGGPPERGSGWHGGPAERGGGWHGGPPAERGGVRTPPAGIVNNGGHGGPPRGAPPPAGGGWHGGGGGAQRPAAHGNGFHR